MTRPVGELLTPAGTAETPRARAVRALGDHTDVDTALVAALLHIGDQLGRIADRLLPLDQLAASAADAATAVEQHWSEDLPDGVPR